MLIDETPQDAVRVLPDGRVLKTQTCRFECPDGGRAAECRMVQDVRTGQWRAVEGCSLFENPQKIGCDQDCARVLNQGFDLRSWRTV